MQHLSLTPMIDDRTPISYIDNNRIPHTVGDLLAMYEFEAGVLSGKYRCNNTYEKDLFLDPTLFLAETFGATQLRLLAAGIRNSLSRIFQLRNTQLYLALQHLPVNR